MAYTHDNLYFDLATPFGKDKLLLRHFHGEERISELFHFRLEMQSESFDLDFATVVGKSVTVTVHLADGSDRWIHGIVGRFVQAGGDGLFATYHADVYPTFWLLAMTADCKIFQEKSTPQILEAVLTDHGLTDYQLQLTGSYSPREYCVQYNESAFAFLSRLMEDEGIFYFFEHQDGKHTLVIADDLSAFKPCPGATELEVGAYGVWTQQNRVTRCALEENVIPGQRALDDFNFETPTTDLVASVDSTAARDGAKRRIYEYPGGFLKKDAGEKRTKVRVAAGDSPQKILRGDSYCRAFFTGAKFDLKKHYREDVNASYVVLQVSHSGTWEGYSNTFEAFPSSVPFRPRRVTPWPRIHSTQTALVVGKKGEEIWTDKYGRIKVQFHWDQDGKNDENSSCWIRVAHGWAGKQWGQIFLPRIGQEVVVSFVDGDPDRPLVTGSVYNAEQTVPYALPGEQTKSTIKSNSSKGGGGYNELRFEDKKDSEEVYFQAEKDMNRVVKNNDTLKVGFEKKDAGDQTIDIYNHRTVTIDQGNEKLQVKTGHRDVLVDTGNDTHQVKQGNRTVLVDTGNDTHQVKQGNRTVTIDAGSDTLTIKQGSRTTKVSLGSSTTQAMKSITLKVGSNSVTIDQQGVTIKGMMVTVQGQTKTDIKGLMTNVNADAILTLKGSLAKLN